jgi:hypothetical protein
MDGWKERRNIKTKDEGWRTKDEGRRMEDDGWKMDG